MPTKFSHPPMLRLWLLLSLSLSSLAIAPAHSANTATAPTAPMAPIAWTAAQIEAAAIRTVVLHSSAEQASAGMQLPGQVELPPQATELISSALAGVVQQVLIAPGENIKAGQIVARLISPELLTWQRELGQAQSQARLAASKLARDEQLYAEGIIAALRVQDSRAHNEQTQLALQERRQALQALGLNASGTLQTQLVLRANAAGTVLEVNALPGQRLEAGMPVAKIARAGLRTLVLQATPAQAQRLRVGEALTVEGCKAPAHIRSIAPQMQGTNQTVQVRADFSAHEPCLRLQQFVQGTIQGSSANDKAHTELTVPHEAVVHQAGQSYVFVRHPQGFVPTRVVLGASRAQQWPVQAGLQAGDEIAISGLAALKGAWLGLGAEGKKEQP